MVVQNGRSYNMISQIEDILCTFRTHQYQVGLGIVVGGLLKSLLTSRRVRHVIGTTRRYGIYGNELVGFV
jgi:hypothetical protein